MLRAFNFLARYRRVFLVVVASIFLDRSPVSVVEEEAIAPSAKNSKAKGTKRKNVLSDTDGNHIVCGELASVKEQAIGRIFRQGQTSEVTVTRIILRGPDGERCRLDD